MRLLKMMGFGPQIVFGGGDGGGGGGGGSDDDDNTTTTTTTTASRSQADVQAEINAALDASGGAWTNELNGLVAERNDIVDSGGGGGGTSNADAMREYASSMTAAGQTSLSGANPTTVAPASNISDYEREAFGTDQATFYNNQTDDTPVSVTNAERVAGETIEDLLNTGQITLEQANDPSTSGSIVDLLNNTGVPSVKLTEAGSNPLLSDTMGIGSDGNLVDAVTGATDGGALINTIGTPTVETPTITPVVNTSTNPRIGYESGQDVLSSSPAYLTGADGSGANTVGQVDDSFYGGAGAAVNPGAAIITAQRDATGSGTGGLLKAGAQKGGELAVDAAANIIDFFDPAQTYGYGYNQGIPQLDSSGNVIPEIDFGFAKALGENPQIVSQVAGTDNRVANYLSGVSDDIGAASAATLAGISDTTLGQAKDRAIFGTGGFGPDPAALLAEVIYGAPIVGAVAGTTIANPVAGITLGGTLTVGELSNEVESRIQNKIDAGEFGNVSLNQAEAIKRDYIDRVIPLAAASGAIESLGFTKLVPGGLTGQLVAAAGLGALEEGVSEPTIVESNVNRFFTPTVDADAALVGGVLGGGATTLTAAQRAALSDTSNISGTGGTPSGIETVATPPSGGGTGLTAAQRTALSDTTGIAGTSVAPTVSTVAPAQPGTSVDVANQTSPEIFSQDGTVLDAQPVIATPTGPAQPSTNQDVIDAVFTDIVPPNVTSTAPAQIAAPDASVASGVISGTPTTITAPTTQVVPQLPAPATVDTTPFVDISAIAPPNVTTNIDQITIPGTNITVDVPALQTPTTDSAVNTAQPSGLSALGTGGAFNPNVSTLPASVTASPIAQPVTETAATDAVSQEQSIIDTIAQEVAQEGGLTIETAQEIAAANNLSVQEVATLAETAMGVPDQIQSIGTGVPQFQMDGTAPAGVNTSTVTQAAVDFVNSGSTSQSDLLRIARENGIVSGPGTGTMPAQIIAELRDRVSNPNFKVVPKSDASTTSLVPVSGTGTNVVPANTANTGIATLDTSQSEVGGLQGEILDADNAVVTRDTSPAIESPIIEGTTSSMEVDAANPTETEVFINEGEVITPTDVTTEVNVPVNENVTIDGTTNTTEVVVTDPNTTRPVVVQVPPVVEQIVTEPETVVDKTFVQPVVQPDDEDEITIEVDEPVDVDDDEDVVVEIDPPINVDDNDDDDVAVEEDAPFECPDGFEAVQVNGTWRCQSTDDMPEKVRPTAGAYYRPNPNPNYGAAARRRRA